MGKVTESIYDGATCVVPLADVQHIEKVQEYSRAVHQTLPAGLRVIMKSTVWSQTRDAWANPIIIPQGEAAAFIRAWCNYRAELEADTLAELAPTAAECVPTSICGHCKGKTIQHIQKIYHTTVKDVGNVTAENVPMWLCTKCGAQWLGGAADAVISAAVEKAREQRKAAETTTAASTPAPVPKRESDTCHAIKEVCTDGAAATKLAEQFMIEWLSPFYRAATGNIMRLRWRALEDDGSLPGGKLLTDDGLYGMVFAVPQSGTGTYLVVGTVHGDPSTAGKSEESR